MWKPHSRPARLMMVTGGVVVALVIGGLLLWSNREVLEGCEPSDLGGLGGSIVRLDPGTGRVIDTERTDYVGSAQVVGSKLLLGLLASNSDRKVRSLDIRPLAAAPVGIGDDGRDLVFRAAPDLPPVWRLPRAGGTVVGEFDGVAVVVGRDSQLRGIRSSDGSLVWNARDQQVLIREARLVGDRVYAAGHRRTGAPSYNFRDGSLTGQAMAFDARTGAALWSAALPDPVAGTEVLVEGDVVIVTQQAVPGPNEGKAWVAGLATGDGAIRWERHLDRPQVKALASNGSQTLAVTTDRVVTCP